MTLRSLLDRLGHLGAWAGLYVTAAYVCFWQLSAAGPANSWPNPAALISVMLAATGVYAIDRVKIADRFLDPADFAAHPARYAFLRKHTLAVRGMAMVAVAMAMGVGAFASPLLPWLIALSVLGVIVYAPGPRGRLPRPKDLLLLKNVFVACGVVSLAVVATAMIGPISRAPHEAFWEVVRARLAPIADAAALLLLRVIVDAVVCDIDDVDADAAYGTHTLATAIGPGRTLAVAIAARFVVAGLILAVARAPSAVRVAWAVVSVAGAASLAIGPRGRPLKTRIDVGFVAEAVVVSAVVALA